MNITLNILEKLNVLIELENKIKLSADEKFSESKYYTDLLAIAVVDRSLKLSRGFRCLIQSENIQCAVIIARCQIDNVARFHGMKLVKGNERGYVYNFLDPKKKFNSLKDNQNEKLSDKYLVDRLSERHSWIKKVYDEFCGYTHLSEKHHRSCSGMTKHNNNVSIEFSSCLSRYDRLVNEISYSNAIDRFLDISNILLQELGDYFSKREFFHNNSLDFVPNKNS